MSMLELLLVVVIGLFIYHIGKMGVYITISKLLYDLDKNKEPEWFRLRASKSVLAVMIMLSLVLILIPIYLITGQHNA